MKIAYNTIIISALLALLVLFLVLAIATEAFVFRAILHIVFHLLLTCVAIRIARKYLIKGISEGMKKPLLLCLGVFVFDLVVVDAIRYIVTHGVSTVLFLPACIPVCFMIAMHYSPKAESDNIRKKRILTYIVGLPLLLLALYFETISFMK